MFWPQQRDVTVLPPLLMSSGCVIGVLWPLTFSASCCCRLFSSAAALRCCSFLLCSSIFLPRSSAQRSSCCCARRSLSRSTSDSSARNEMLCKNPWFWGCYSTAAQQGSTDRANLHWRDCNFERYLLEFWRLRLASDQCLTTFVAQNKDCGYCLPSLTVEAHFSKCQHEQKDDLSR